MSAEKTNKISVDTPLGELTAEIGGDPSYPEIFVYLKRKDGFEIDLTAVSTDGKDDGISAYIYGNTSRDDYTLKLAWGKEELTRKIEGE